MVCLDAAYGPQDQVLVIQDTRGEFMNIYGRVLYISLSVTLSEYYELFHLLSRLSYAKQSSGTDSGEEKAAAMTRDNKDKVGLSNYPPPTARVFVFAVSNSTLAERCATF